MNTDDNSNLVDITDDLNEFETEFFQSEPVAPEPVVDEVDDEQELLDNPEDNPLAPEEDEIEEEEVEETPEPKKKTPLQERIDELTAKAREAERREAATKADLMRRIEELEANSKQEKEEPKKVEVRDVLPDNAPNPDAVDADGKAIYPLGEFDPLFIRDLTKFTIDTETAKAKEAAEQEAAQRAQAEELHKVQEDWNARVEGVRDELPDYQEKVGGMVEAFKDIDPAYGDFLALTLMQSEAGPRVLYYLAENIGEAQQIVASGPSAALLAIGRLEAKLSAPKKETTATSKVTNAPEPPDKRTRGSGGKFSIAADTDDLDAFERAFYNKK
jgi:hypothetical protein